jgi:hypothetical protein
MDFFSPSEQGLNNFLKIDHGHCILTPSQADSNIHPSTLSYSSEKICETDEIFNCHLQE